MRNLVVCKRWLETILSACPPSWSEDALELARVRAGLTRLEAHAAAPNGAIDLMDAWFEQADRSTLEALSHCPNDTKLRARATLAIRTNIESLASKQALRSALLLLARPQNLRRSLKMSWRFSDLVWRAVGDRTEGFGFYSKRTILLGVRSSTLAFWLNDQSKDSLATWSFLDRRIENVMQIGKLKAVFKRFRE
jgi:ubiquinone biosynthesis protein COQ9